MKLRLVAMGLKDRGCTTAEIYPCFTFADSALVKLLLNLSGIFICHADGPGDFYHQSHNFCSKP